jgi:hypothetical protein
VDEEIVVQHHGGGRQQEGVFGGLIARLVGDSLNQELVVGQQFEVGLARA